MHYNNTKSHAQKKFNASTAKHSLKNQFETTIYAHQSNSQHSHSANSVDKNSIRLTFLDTNKIAEKKRNAESVNRILIKYRLRNMKKSVEFIILCSVLLARRSVIECN